MKTMIFLVIIAPPEYLSNDDYPIQCDGQVCYYREIYVENGEAQFRQIIITVKVR